MAVFKFRARNAKTGDPVKAEITLGGTSRGYTPNRKGDYLIAETSSSGSFSWYAKYNGRKIGEGKSSGGEIEVIYCP
ncbi:hypothetical protein EU508_00125 [Pseudoalteromonas fuliginea]|uniref:Uncharacterized protein n=1 Tax=Pseudoalteromonas fuliginea TaxID=1872678 RepID=A0AB73BMB6_9GAMM|nr:hypothetical protein [Pseudoalteromonas fuliginea]KAA1166177.1 hypothetical protein EU508_00125 [Pseudoalteromonas fuliginea]